MIYLFVTKNKKNKKNRLFKRYNRFVLFSNEYIVSAECIVNGYPCKCRIHCKNYNVFNIESSVGS